MRCKGTFIALNDQEIKTEYILQGVEDLFEFREVTEYNLSGIFKHRFLIIGKQLNQKFLTDKISEALIKI